MIVMERLKNFFKIVSINNIFIYTFEQSATSISFIEIEFVSESSQQLYHFSWQIFENFYIILTNSLQTSLDQQGRLEGVDTNDVTDSYWFTFTCRFSVKFFFYTVIKNSGRYYIFSSGKKVSQRSFPLQFVFNPAKPAPQRLR